MTVIDHPGPPSTGRDAAPDDATRNGRRRPPKRNVVAEIADRRRLDIREEVARQDYVAAR